LILAAKSHIPLDIMEFVCKVDGTRKICIWNKEPLNKLGRCKRTAYIEHNIFLKYSLLPALKQTQSPKSVFNIARDVIVQTTFGISFQNFLFPELAERVSRLYATGLPAKLQKEEETNYLSESRRTVHIAEESKYFWSWTCSLYNNKLCDPAVQNRDREEFREKYQQIKKSVNDKKKSIYGSEKQAYEKAGFSPVPLVGNISSLFALMSILLLFSALSFGFEMLMYDLMKSCRKMRNTIKTLHHVVFSTGRIGFSKIVNEKWFRLYIGNSLTKIRKRRF